MRTLRSRAVNALASASTCPQCGCPAELRFRSPDRNRRATPHSFDYHRCTACDLIFLADDVEDLAAHYPSDYHAVPSPAETRRLAERERWRLEFVLPWAASGRLVEIGPGWGLFALLARDAGFQVTGIEMDEDCCAYLRDVVGVDAVHSDEPERVLAKGPPARVVAMWHVIEHVRGPFELVRAAGDCLEPGGILVVATPNPDALGFRVLRSRWPHVDAPRHQYLIPAGLLTDVAAAHGLERVRLDSDDPGTRGWNTFGWTHALRPGRVGRDPGRAPALAGAVLARLVRPLESGPGRGAAYTAVFRKPA